MHTAIQIMEKIIIIAGPTAIGKSAIALEAAEKLNGEIISCDSAQVYKYMDIGTAKAGISERRQITHHLIDVVYPDYNFTAADFKRLCKSAVKDILSRNKTPILCGGTGLYIDAFLYDYELGHISQDSKIRSELNILYDVKGADFTHGLLLQIDYKAAQAIHKNDKNRVVRALEICFLTGKDKSAQTAHAVKKSEYDFLFFALQSDRAILYDKINCRVDEMIGKGLIEEVDSLLKMGYGNCKSMQAIGYKEIAGYLSGKCDKQSAIDALKQNTRNYAKRQTTWFNKANNAIFLSANSEAVQKILNNKLR